MFDRFLIRVDAARAIARPGCERIVAVRDEHLGTVAGLAEEGRRFQGVLYAGLMLTDTGPKVLEFNARFGDPETQVMLPRLKTDLVDIMLAVIDGKLGKMNIEWSPDPCVGVVMASGGYPGRYQTGFPITGLDKLDKGIFVFHAGTALKGGVVTSGGRVLTVAANGKTIAEARSPPSGHSRCGDRGSRPWR